jgi:glutamate racemase
MFEGPWGPDIDVVVLACTHFPLIREAIQAACPPGVTLIDSGEAVARQALRIAPKGTVAELLPDNHDRRVTAYVTGGAANRAAMAPALAAFGYDFVETVDV